MIEPKIQAYRIDVDGFLFETVLINDDNNESDIIREQYPNLYKPKWNGEKWIEGATQEYINSFKPKE